VNPILPILVVGLGNAYRSDDIVGLLVARQIRELNVKGVEVIEGVADGTQIIDAWAGRKAAFIIDCAVSGAEAGHIHRFDGLQESPPAKFFGTFSTHYFDVTAALEMAKALNRLPERLIIYGIEGARFAHGVDITPEILQAAQIVIRELRQDIETAG
jgi:hydrogenase maturation protease